MKKLSFFLALALCVVFSVAVSATVIESDGAGEAESESVSEGDIVLDEDVIIDDTFIPDSDIGTSDSVSNPAEPVPAPLPPVQNPITVDNSAVVASIQGLQQSLLAGQTPDFDNMTLLENLELFGLEIVEQTSDFALLFFSRTNTFILVSHNTIVNLGVM